MKVTREQVIEWTENPVTEALLGLAKEELENINQTPATDCYYPGEPQKTQDNLTDLNSRGVAWAVFCELLEGDWAYMEEDSGE